MAKTNLVRPSRDGDQFHYLWAARRCLKLLSATSDLVAVTIEGISPREAGSAEAVTAGEDVIDIAEYFGSEDFSDARLVRYMQLKHSTLQAHEAWTASGLEKSITGFAERYRELLKTFVKDALTGKLEFWFVTNRPISGAFAETVEDVAEGRTVRHIKEVKKIKRFTGLSGDDLAVFCKLIHFEGRQDDYWDQRNILFQDVGGYLPDSDVYGPLKLKELVTRKALSEGERNPSITKMDVFRALDTDESALFPAANLIAKLDGSVARDQELGLVAEIIAAKAPVVIHAPGGIGKTIFANRIADNLPRGSKCILYDCFGNGQYRNASGYRHRHKDGLVQIANELASKGLCHLLIPTVHADSASYVRAFVHRIGQASNFIRLQDPKALLCIVVDAADNAQMAAEEIGEKKSFVRDIIREKMPDNVRLVFLCRSHRQHYLDPPREALSRELEPFSRAETAVHLRLRFPEANEHDVDEFHRLSSCNPRVQALALSRNETLPITLRLLGPNPKSVEDTIGSLLEAAIDKLKDHLGPLERSQVDSICTALAALRPLIPLSVLSAISHVPESAIKSFVIDIGRPLRLAGDSVQFFDEPAETWFRERYKPTSASMGGFISILYPLASKSPYVASVLPQLMLDAGQFSNLVDLALKSDALPETSPLERRDIELQRLQFALKAGLRSKRYLDATKLALKAGGETAGDDRQRKILQANTDLSSTFLDVDLIQEIVSRGTFGSGWLGSHHAYEAALMSGCPALVGDARSRLRMASEWLRNWSRLSEEERGKERISDEDIVALTFAEINIHGAEAAAHSLGRWTPREVSFRVGLAVAKRLIDHNRIDDLNAFAVAADNNLCLVLGIAVALQRIRKVPPFEVTQRAFRLLASTRISLSDGGSFTDRYSALNAVVILVEAALEHSHCSKTEAASVLSRYLPSEPPSDIASRFSNTRSYLLRGYSLRATLIDTPLKLVDLAHGSLRQELEGKNQHSTSRDLQEFKEDIGALLPWHNLRARVVCGIVTGPTLNNELALAREASNTAARIHYRDDHYTSNEIALLWFEILFRLQAADETTLGAFSSWKSSLKRPLFTRTLTTLARLCCENPNGRKNALEFALEAFNLTNDERSDAEQKSDGFIEASRAILCLSKGEAHGYFNEAVEVASKIGDENLSRWDAILDLADRCSRTDRPVPETAYRFARCAELTYDYVVRDKHFDWHATVKALTGLCPPSSLAVFSRWRDRGFGSSERIFPTAVRKLIERGALDPLDALPLIGFRGGWRHEKLLDEVLNACKSSDEKASIAAHFFRYSQFNSSNFKELQEVIRRHGMLLEGLDEAVQFNDDMELKRKSRKVEENGPDLVAVSVQPRDWNSVFEGINLASANGISESYRKYKASERPWDHEHFFQQTLIRVPIGSEVEFILSFGEVPEFELYHLRVFLEQCPREWSQRPAIRRAFETILKKLCRRYCLNVAKYRHYEIFPFRTACLLSGADEADIVEVVLDGIGETADSADAARLFSLVGLLAIKLSEDEALEALNFGLELFSSSLEEKDGDGPWSTGLLPPSDINAAVAGYVWAAMAAPEAVTRWEGAHTVLGFVALGRKDILEHLFNFSSENVGGPFVDAKLPFYSLHALQWFLIGVTRGAMANPAALALYGQRLMDLALKGEPHILIRLFAARAVRILMDHGVVDDQATLRHDLEHVAKSPFPAVESKSYDRFTRSDEAGDGNDDDSFYFSLDIGPYWYAPLGRVFGLSQGKIESEALTVIRGQLRFAGRGRWDEDERSRRKLYQQDHTYHSHGSYPRADSLNFYQAYHAMLIVAGRNLACGPVHCDSEYGVTDEFADWLERHDLSRQDGRWLWDRRDPEPLEQLSWLDCDKTDENYNIVTTADFHEALHGGAMTSVWGHWTTADAEREQSVDVHSALVSPEHSEALLRALSTAENRYDYAIPAAESDMEIKEFGYSLKGWIIDRSGDRGLDGQDRWAGGISYPAPRPAEEIRDLMGLQTDTDQRMWIGKDHSIAMISQVWGNFDDGNRHENVSPERGNRINASHDFLKALLGKLQRDLIIAINIDRRRRYRSYESSIENDKDRIPTNSKIYLLKADGSLHTI
ncbi:AVAST type 3 anti-phage nuclease/ATPase Avs3a [Neorhizobium sp. DAR64872/K0K18]|uniref:AVAST type 3 anti-phage nuclease/ATPase Avs3a n=1 Tax=Neorhizobium sp. DAR64872/K0K18 TaxID=3421958 RepID=UPI003D2E5FAB